MKAFKTEGVILRRRSFGEADRILTVFSLHRGKISVLAKGVRRITSRRAGNVELLNRVQMFLHPGKNFLILTEAEALNTYQPLKEDLTLSTYAYHIVELADKLLAEDQENRGLYLDLTQLLDRLSKRPRQLLIRAFEVKTLSKLGFWAIENLPDVNKGIIDLLYSLEILSWDQIEKVEVNQTQAVELERVLRYYIERVIESKLKSRQFLKNV